MAYNPNTNPGYSNPYLIDISELGNAITNMIQSQSNIFKLKAQDEMGKIAEFKQFMAMPIEDMMFKHKEQFAKMRDDFEKEALSIYSKAKGRPNFTQLQSLERKKQDMMLTAKHSNFLKERYTQLMPYLINNVEEIDPKTFSDMDNWVKGLDAKGNAMKIEDTPDPFTLVKKYPTWNFSEFVDKLETPTKTNQNTGVISFDEDGMRQILESQTFSGISGMRNLNKGISDEQWKNKEEAINKIVEIKKNMFKENAGWKPESTPKTPAKISFDYDFNTNMGGGTTNSYTFQPDIPNLQSGVPANETNPGFIFSGTDRGFKLSGYRDFIPYSMYKKPDGEIYVDGQITSFEENEQERIPVPKKVDDETKPGNVKIGTKNYRPVYDVEQDKNYFTDDKGNLRYIHKDDNGNFYFYMDRQNKSGTKPVELKFNDIRAYMDTKYRGIADHLEKAIANYNSLTPEQQAKLKGNVPVGSSNATKTLPPNNEWMVEQVTNDNRTAIFEWNGSEYVFKEYKD